MHFSEPSPAPPRIPSLDGWRALAIMLVLGDHWIYTNGFPPAWHRIGAVFHGDLGVRIFFVLSGFLITLLILQEYKKKDAFHLGHFFLRRAFRILPVYYAYLGVLALLTVLGLYSDAAGSWFGSLTFTRNFFGHGDSATNHFWSLAVEEQFYLVWPALFALLGLWRRPRAIQLGIPLVLVLLCPLLRVCAPDGLPEPGLFERLLAPRSILLYADSLAVGCLGAWFAIRHGGSWTWRATHTWLSWLAIALVVAGRWIQVQSHFAPTRFADALVPSFQAWAILASLWLSTHPAYPLFRLLNHRVIVGLGVLSYSLYIWHFLFVAHFIGPSLAAWPTHDWRLWWLPSLALAGLSYRYLEKPLVLWRRRLRA